MIKITSTYYIKVENNPVCYTLMRRRMSKPKDGGDPQEAYTNVGYYGSMQNALLGVMERLKADRLVDKDMKISEAIEILREADKEAVEAIKSSCPKYNVVKE